MIDWFYFWTLFRVQQVIMNTKLKEITEFKDLQFWFRFWWYMNYKAMCLIEIKKTIGRHNYTFTIEHIKDLFWKDWGARR